MALCESRKGNLETVTEQGAHRAHPVVNQRAVMWNRQLRRTRKYARMYTWRVIVSSIRRRSHLAVISGLRRKGILPMRKG